jgi:hydroxymethylglutaryl-CoA synthase
VREKSVPGLDEDVVTMSIEAARNALGRARVNPTDLGAVWVGSESHPYAVKPSSTVVAEAIGAVPNTLAADWQFACKAGTEALQGAFGLVASGMARYALAIGMDTAQGRPGDALEYTAGAGGAAFIVGPGEEATAILEASHSIVTDTPDFWRRQHEHYPEHASRFTGEPAYFRHVLEAGRALMESLGATAKDYTHAVFHQPNAKFPVKAGQKLGFKAEQLTLGLLANQIGNTYAGASLIGFSAILDRAEPGDRVLVVSFGSGAGSDAFSFRVTERVRTERERAQSESPPKAIPTTADYVARRVQLDYATYARHRHKLVLD